MSVIVSSLPPLPKVEKESKATRGAEERILLALVMVWATISVSCSGVGCLQAAMSARRKSWSPRWRTARPEKVE